MLFTLCSYMLNVEILSVVGRLLGQLWYYGTYFVVFGFCVLESRFSISFLNLF